VTTAPAASSVPSIPGAGIARARTAAARIAAIPGLRVLGPSDATGPGSGFCHLDETKLLVGTGGLAVDARDVLTRLNRVHGVQPELSGPGHLLCITTIANTDHDMDRLVDGLTETAAYFGSRTDEGADAGLVADLLALRADQVLTPREAFFAVDEAVPLTDATGRVSAEAITPYPPGIPLVMPGERLTAEAVDLLRALAKAGTPISASDPSLQHVLVVR
jgi:arginine/lysine/ornithine decarboxylase